MLLQQEKIETNVTKSFSKSFIKPQFTNYFRSKEGFKDWTFSTVKCWGEKPQGVWKLSIADEGDGTHEEGVLKSWRITFFGSQMTSHDIQERKR